MAPVPSALATNTSLSPRRWTENTISFPLGLGWSSDSMLIGSEVMASGFPPSTSIRYRSSALPPSASSLGTADTKKTERPSTDQTGNPSWYWVSAMRSDVPVVGSSVKMPDVSAPRG